MPKNLIIHKPSFSTRSAEVGFWRVVLAGLGTLVGVGIFVGVGIAAGVADRYLVLALVLVAVLSLSSGLNSIQLALYHALPFRNSGDGHGDAAVYGYSNGLLNTWLGFVAALSLAFSCAATAAAAALGVAGYALNALGVDPIWLAPIAVVVTVALAGCRLVGLHPNPDHSDPEDSDLEQRPVRLLTTGTTVVGLVALGVFAMVGILQALVVENSPNGASGELTRELTRGLTNGWTSGSPADSFQAPSITTTLPSWFKAASLMVVAYGGYERIAAFVNTVVNAFASLSPISPFDTSQPNFIQLDPDPDPPVLLPVKSLQPPHYNLRSSHLHSSHLPSSHNWHNLHDVHKLSNAMIVTIALATVLYGGVAIAAISTVGSTVLSNSVEAFVAPLVVASRQLKLLGNSGMMTAIMSVGASLALLGMTGYLLAQLSWVLWTMGQQRDLPKFLARVNATTTTPNLAWIVAAGIIACIALTSDIKAIWSFGAFALLLHMAITNLAALQLRSIDRLYPRWMAWLGLGLSLFLIPWLEWRIWLMGLGLIVIGLIWRGINLWSAEQAGG